MDKDILTVLKHTSASLCGRSLRRTIVGAEEDTIYLGYHSVSKSRPIPCHFPGDYGRPMPPQSICSIKYKDSIYMDTLYEMFPDLKGHIVSIDTTQLGSRIKPTKAAPINFNITDGLVYNGVKEVGDVISRYDTPIITDAIAEAEKYIAQYTNSQDIPELVTKGNDLGFVRIGNVEENPNCIINFPIVPGFTCHGTYGYKSKMKSRVTKSFNKIYAWSEERVMKTAIVYEDDYVRSVCVQPYYIWMHRIK